MRRKKIGTMDFHGSVDITDPCYNRDVWCRMTDVKIRKGVYTCIAWHHKDKGTFNNGEPYCYDVIGIIGIYLDGVIPCQKEMKKIGDIGVDAGLAGFFHNKPDYTDDEWAAFCDRVRHGDAWLIKEGFYSSSGYGDGCYGVYAYERGGEITAIEIRFLKGGHWDESTEKEHRAYRQSDLSNRSRRSCIYPRSRRNAYDEHGPANREDLCTGNLL